MTVSLFKGRVGRTVHESTPHWPELPRPRKGAPNVVVVLFDDLGFAHLGCYGSSIATPNIDRLAADGLRFTNFHTTALCSPTRAALLTGCNHHSVGMRGLANWNTGFPNCTGTVSKSAATVAEVLRPTGYSTFAVGKWHLAPIEQTSPAGPFDQWPLSRGFDRYYGFLDGETDQWRPDLTCDNHAIRPPKSPEEGYHLSEDLVDQAIAMVRSQKVSVPEKPFFLYLAFGATHAPHQAPKDYIARYRGRFDAGWDVVRKEWYERQKQLGIIPKDTELAPRNPGVKAWSELSPDEKTLALRLQEAFAGFLEHTDAQIGRLIDYLSASGELDNTLFLLMSDNGASQEGGPAGMVDYSRYFNGRPETLDESLARIDQIGTPEAFNNYPWGWAQVGNTPGKRYKQNTHGGGIRDPLIVHWPAGVSDKGGIRHQFHHVTDIAPTIFEAIGAARPDSVNGYPQMPIHGTSLFYTFAPDAAAAPTRKPVQYFEMFGHRGIWADGWKAVTYHEPNTSWDADAWELYHLDSDFSESRDLAQDNPEKLRELVERWWVEAGRNGVLPLDDRRAELWRPTTGWHDPRNRTRYVYHPPFEEIRMATAPALGNRTFLVTADIARDHVDDEGCIFSFGDHRSGLALYVQKGRLVFDYNLFGQHLKAVSDTTLPTGKISLGVSVERLGRVGRASVLIGDAVCGRIDIPFLIRRHAGGNLNLGRDDGIGVSDDYRAPFPFQGRISEVVVELPARRTSEAKDAAKADVAIEMARQ
ncbi:arylsulfatase [Bradyrhizobium sp. LHD-71]|uniref:arylsulfatase n=1 Tax=Bradyrhizobium sp. LHD-71 TaxID=3072141 RepID=UPI00280D20A0|nr:arylsulfatase [Bradyrhizobium sp. LHD-71]MDQ8730461.1 arylsulfatase [Bradyrhizobium sp. LHD-71]